MYWTKCKIFCISSFRPSARWCTMCLRSMTPSQTIFFCEDEECEDTYLYLTFCKALDIPVSLCTTVSVLLTCLPCSKQHQPRCHWSMLKNRCKEGWINVRGSVLQCNLLFPVDITFCRSFCNRLKIFCQWRGHLVPEILMFRVRMSGADVNLQSARLATWWTLQEPSTRLIKHQCLQNNHSSFYSSV